MTGKEIYRLSSQKDGIEVEAVNVHLVVSTPPKYAVAQYMGYLKGKLALQPILLSAGKSIDGFSIF